MQERSLLGELDVILAEIGANSETVLDTGVEDDLVGDGAHFLEQLLGLVALLFGEDLVGFWVKLAIDSIGHEGWIGHTSSSNGQRASHALDLLLVDERRVCSVSDVNALALGQEASNVLAAKAVSDGTNLLRALLFHVRQSLLDNRVDLVGKVALALRATLLQPSHDVEILGAVELDGVALEEIGHDDEVAVGGELVGDELGVDELMADHVGEDDDGDGGVLGLGVGDVGGDLGGWLDRVIERIW